MADENEIAETTGSVGAEDEIDEFGGEEKGGQLDAAAAVATVAAEAMDVEVGGEGGDGRVVIIGESTGTTAGAEWVEARCKRKGASTSSPSPSTMAREQLAALVKEHKCKGRQGRKRHRRTVVSSYPDRTTTSQGQEQEPTPTSGRTPRCRRGTPGTPSCGTAAACTERRGQTSGASAGR